MFIFIIFLFSFNFSDAGVYVNNWGGYQACSFGGSCNSFPTCYGINYDFALGGRLLGIIVNCDGYYQSSFYNGETNTWSTVEDNLGSSDKIAAGVNVGIFTKGSGSGGMVDLYAYDIAYSGYETVPHSNAGGNVNIGSGPYKLSAGGNVAILSTSSKVYFYSTQLGWEEFSISGVQAVEAGNYFATVATNDKVYLFRAGWDGYVVSDPYGGGFRGLDAAYDNAAVIFGGTAMVFSCDEECSEDDLDIDDMLINAAGGATINEFKVGQQLAMFHFDNTLTVYDFNDDAIAATPYTSGTFMDLDVGGSVGGAVFDRSGNYDYYIYDATDGGFGLLSNTLNTGVLVPLEHPYKYIEAAYDNIAFTTLYGSSHEHHGFKAGTYDLVHASGTNFNFAPYASWPKCTISGQSIGLSQVYLSNLNQYAAFSNAWSMDTSNIYLDKSCSDYTCCSPLGIYTPEVPTAQILYVNNPQNEVTINDGDFNIYIDWAPKNDEFIGEYHLEIDCAGCSDPYHDSGFTAENPGSYFIYDSGDFSETNNNYMATFYVVDMFGRVSNHAQMSFRVQEPIPVNNPPVASIDRVYPPKVFAGETISFRGSASDPEYDPLTYEWRIDGAVVSDRTIFDFDTTSLDGGIHNVEFRVSDGENPVVIESGSFEILVIPEPEASWITIDSGINEDLYAVDFISSNTGYVVGESGTLLKTTNRFDWNPLSFPENSLLTGIVFKDQDIGWISTNQGKIFKTENGGNSWSQDLSASVNFNGLDYFNAGWEDYEFAIHKNEVEPNYVDYFPLVSEEYYGGGAVYPGILMELENGYGQDIIPDYSDCIEEDYGYPDEPNTDYLWLSKDGYRYDSKFCRVMNQNGQKLTSAGCVPAGEYSMCDFGSNKVLTYDTDYSLVCCNYVWPSGDIIINDRIATATEDLYPAGKVFYSEGGDDWDFVNKEISLESIDCVDGFGCFGVGGNDIIKANSYESGSYSWFWDKDVVKDYSLQWNSIFQIPGGSSDNFNIVKTGNDRMYVSNGGQVYYYNGATLAETHDYGADTIITDMYDDPYGQFHTAGYEVNSIRYQAGEYNGDPHYEYRYTNYPLDGAVEGLQFVPKSVWGYGSEVYMAGYHVWPVGEYVEDGCLHVYQQGFTWYEARIDCILYDYEHYGAVVYSGDSGNTWEFIGIEDVEEVELNDVFGYNDPFNGLSVYAVGDDEVIWDCTNDPCIEVRGHTGGPDLNAVMVGFYGSTFAAGEDGYIIYKSGPNWYSGSHEFGETINEIFTENHLGSNIVYAVGDEGGVYKKAWDGDWQVISQGIPYTDDCTDVTGGDTPDQTFVVCGNKVYKWFVDDSAESYNGISFVDNQKGWIVGDNGLIRSSVDGGDTWQPIHGEVQSAMQEETEEETEEIPTIQNDYSDISSFGGRTKEVDISAVYDVSLSPNKNQPFLNFRDLFKVSFENLRYSPLPTESQNMYAVDFLNSTFGFVSGAHGAVLGTMDGGNSWNIESYANDTYGSMRDVEIVDDSNVYVVGDGGTIMYRYINNPPSDVEITINAGLSQDVNHPVTPYYTYTNGGNIVLEGSANDQDQIEYEWLVTEGIDYVERGSESTLSLDPGSLSSGMHTIMLKVIDQGGLWNSSTLEIRIKDTTNTIPEAVIENVIACPNDELLNNFPEVNNHVPVTGCSNLVFEGSGYDYDDGYITESSWELINGESSDVYVAGDDLIDSYSTINLESGALSTTHYDFNFKVKDDDGNWSEIDNAWDPVYQGISFIDADSSTWHRVSRYGDNFCEAMCCGDDSSATTSCNDRKNTGLFEGENTVSDSSGRCCGDDVGEYYIVGDTFAKCCDAADYDLVTEAGCYYSNPNNLLRNPSFEVDVGVDFDPTWEEDDTIRWNLIPDGWHIGGGESGRVIELDSSNAKTGIYAMKVKDSNSNAFVGYDFPVSYGQKYKISGYIKVDPECQNNNCFGSIGVHCKNSDHSVSDNMWACPPGIVYNWASVNSPEWTYVEYTTTIDRSDVDYLGIYCYKLGGSVPGEIWCDDFEIERITKPDPRRDLHVMEAMPEGPQ